MPGRVWRNLLAKHGSDEVVDIDLSALPAEAAQVFLAASKDPAASKVTLCVGSARCGGRRTRTARALAADLICAQAMVEDSNKTFAMRWKLREQ